MTGNQTLLTGALHGIVAIVVIVCATVLAALNMIDGGTVVALYGAALGFAGGAALATGTLGATINGKSIVSTETLANHEETLRHAVDAVAVSSPETKL